MPSTRTYRSPPARGLALALLVCILCAPRSPGADPDLPGASARLVVVPAGSYVIPMDNTKQALAAPFNLKAYGLINALLQNNIPVEWVIRAGKRKDEADFTGTARRIFPSALAASNLVFKAGPFVVHAAFTNRAASVIRTWGNSVAVFELMSNTTMDVRYHLAFKPRIAVLKNGGNQAIHTAYLAAAGITIAYYDVIFANQLSGGACYTIATEPHWDATADAETAAIRSFLGQRGNFLAQCIAIQSYENNSTAPGHFHTTRGISKANSSGASAYPNADMAFAQFENDIEATSGSFPAYTRASASAYTNSAYSVVVQAFATNTIDLAAAKLAAGSAGSMVFYLGGHDNKNSTILSYNARRAYLNALFVPAGRPDFCGLNFGTDLAISKSDSTRLAIPGANNVYILIVTNRGPLGVTGARVQDVLPPAISKATWTCVTNAGATVSAASGTGSLDQLVNLPSGGWLTYQLIAWYATSTTCAVSNRATVTVPAGVEELNTSDNAAVDEDYQPALVSAGGQVREDVDGDGEPADPDAGLANVVIRLFSDPNGDGDPADGISLATSLTTAQGAFHFSNLGVGSYVVVSVVPTNMAATADSQGSGNDGRIPLAVSCGMPPLATDLYFLATRVADVSGQVRHDLNGDGNLGTADPGLPGVAITLYTDPNGDGNPADGSLLMATRSDASGNFLFPFIMPGRYVVVEMDEDGYISTADSSGPNDNRVGINLTGGVDASMAFLDWTLSGLAISKTASDPGRLNAGDLITYTIIVTNTRAATQSAVAILDVLPAGLSFVTGSTRVVRSFDIFRDDVDAAAFTNDNGNAGWSGPWIEAGESDGASAGDIRVITNSLRLQNKDNGVHRAANLARYTNSQWMLSLNYRVDSLDNSGDFITLSISTSSATWTTLHTWTGPVSAQTGSLQYDLSSHVSASTVVRFATSANMAGDDHGYFDDVTIQGYTSATGGASPGLITNYTVASGRSLVVTFTASVGYVSSLVNTARVTTASDMTGLVARASNEVAGLVMTQQLQGAVSSATGCTLTWSNSDGPSTNAVDLLYVDSAAGFGSALSNLWGLVATFTANSGQDTGSVTRASPAAIGNNMRFYRIAHPGHWGSNAITRFASIEVYVAKPIHLVEGENWIGLFMIPDRCTVAGVLGTNFLPSGEQMSTATRVEWYGATPSGAATNIVWLSDAGIWLNADGRVADDQALPLNEGFNIVLPALAGPRDLLVIGRVPTNTTVANGLVQTLAPSGIYNIVSYNLPCRTKLKDSGLREAGFTGAPGTAAANPQNSDELRILNRGVGSMGSPKVRILKNGGGQFVYWTGGTRGASAENYPLEVDDALIIYTVRSTRPLTWTPRLPYPVPADSLAP